MSVLLGDVTPPEPAKGYTAAELARAAGVPRATMAERAKKLVAAGKWRHGVGVRLDSQGRRYVVSVYNTADAEGGET